MTVHDSQSDDQRPAESAQKPASTVSKRPNRSTTVGGVALAVLVAVYAVAQPVLNERFGWQLPGVEQFLQNDEPAVAEKLEKKPELTTPKTTPLAAEKPPKVVDSKPKTGTGPLANVRSKESTSSTRPTVPPTAAKAPPTKASPTKASPTKASPTKAPPAEDSLLFGILADQGNDRFLSPAGLMYVPGSQEGHRLKHVERHTVDDPGRPGSHGVFDGGMETALATIDKAYRKAKTGSQTSKQEEDGRTIYTVDMGSRVGYVGGSDGKRRKNPMARRVRLVLERNRVITAYPM